ncbi:MAG: alpha-2-macroglobulin [Desulfovibrionaceae bacterium]
MRFLLVLLSLMFLCGNTALAATRSAPAYLAPSITNCYPWTDGILIRLEPDAAQCRKKYGKNWQDACRVFLGSAGDRVKGARISPAVPGTWRWDSDGTSIRFTPEQPLTPAATYTVSLKELHLPAQAVLTRTQETFVSMPQAVTLEQWKFWTDPSARGAHALSATLSFTWPVSGEPALSLLPPAGSSLRLGQTECVWNAARDSVTISAPVQRLAREDVPVSLHVPGIRRFDIKDGRLRFSPATQRPSAEFRLTATGSSRLFAVEHLVLENARDDALNQGYQLRLTTSLHVRPQEVLRQLKVIQLPRTLLPRASSPYNWAQAPSVPASALNRGTPLSPVSLQPDDSPVSTLRFRVDAAPGSYLLVYLPPDFSSATGLPLGRQWRQILHASSQSATLDFLQPGNVLPLSGERRLDVYATDVDVIRWEVQQVRDPFMALVATHSGRPFTAPLEDAAISLESTSERSQGEIALKPAAPGRAQFATLDLSPLLARRNDCRGLMRVTLYGMRAGETVAETSRMVLVTDLGLLVKQSATGSYNVFVCSLDSGTPVRDASVRVLGANGRPVTSARTDAQGHACLPGLQGLEREKRPVAVVAEKEASGTSWMDMAWLPLHDSSLMTEYSAFPVTGRSTSASGINAYVFSQRGIFRPGETLRFGCLARRADWKALPADLPLTALLTGPAGTELMKRTFTVGPDGLAEFSWPVPQDAPTGRYRLDIELDGGQVLGSGAVRVEEFQPDTLGLRAAVHPRPAAGWLRVSADGLTDGQPVTVEARLRNLHGLPAAGHRVTAALHVAPAVLSFPGFEDYQFHDALPFRGEGVSRDLADATTDGDGVARLSLPADITAGSTVRCSLLVEGFEADGGRAVSQPVAALLSPLDMMLGFKPAGGATNLEFIPQGRQAMLEFVAVDPNLRRVDTGPLTFTVYARRFVTSLVTDARGAYRYDETPVDTELASSTQRVDAAKGLRWTIPTDKAGEYLLAVRDAAGRTLAMTPFTVAGERIAAADHDLAAGTLRLKLDKSTYASGDTMQIFLSVPYDGAGLITVEREDVVASAWFQAKAGDSVQRITLPRDFEGRGYVNVTFTRALSSPDIYMEPSASAVAPFSASIARRDMGLRISAPPKASPGSTLDVRITAREPGRALVFAVDEGVLQLTRFSTPSPLAYLLEDRALDVRTMQAFRLLMPDHARLQGRIPGFGGGMSLNGGRFHNPFRHRDEPPLATWQMVDVGPQAATVRIPLPDYYNGTARIMAVAASTQSAGSAERSVTASAPLILTPRLPLTVTPGDRFTGSLTAANSTDRPMTVRPGLSADAGLKFAGALPASITIPAGGETTLPLPFEAMPEPGAAAVTFSARAEDGTRAERGTSVSVRPATHRRVTRQAGKVSGPTRITVPRELFNFEARGSASVAALPLPVMGTLARYLESYPYGCLEQRISKALVCVALRERPELPPAARERERIISAAVGRMQSEFDGSLLSPWPDGGGSLLLTAYAADLLLEMRDAGMGIPEPLLNSLCDVLERHVGNASSSLEDGRAAAYAIWVLTREGRVTTQLLERLRTGLDEAGIRWQGDVTAALLAASQRIMRMRSTQPFHAPDAVPGRDWFDDLAAQSLHATVLAAHFPERLEGGTVAEELADSTLLAIREGRYATFSAAQAVRALHALGASAGSGLKGVRLTCADGEAQATAQLRAGGTLLTLDAPQCRAYSIEPQPGTAPLYWQVTTEGFDRIPPAEDVSQGMRISRVYRNAAGEPVSTARQGEVLTVTVTASADSGDIRDCVLLDLLPGGVEMLLSPDGAQEQPEGLVRVDRRDDRMIIFAHLSTRPFSYSYRVRAVNRGRFILPPAQAEAMYDQNLHAGSTSGMLEVR